MDTVLTINGGTPVRIKGISPQINGAAYEIIPQSYTIKGELLNFTYNGVLYINISLIHYDKRDSSKGGLNFGYCKSNAYNTYRNSNSDERLKDFLKHENWFLDFQPAQIGDIFKIQKVELSKDLTTNYTKYFIHAKYEFRISNLNMNFSKSTDYPSDNPDLSSPNYSKKELVDQDQLSSFSTKDEGNFFTKNFKNKVGNLNISKESKEVLYEGIMKICFRIDRIFNDVLDTLAIKKLDDILNFIKNIPAGEDVHTKISSYNNNVLKTSVDKTIAHLLVDWGYRSYADTKELTLDFNKDKFYGGLYKPFEVYYNALVNLYYNLFQKNETELFGAPSTDSGTWTDAILKEQSNKRFDYLIYILPDQILTLLDFSQRKKIIDLYIRANYLPSQVEELVLRLIYSFSLVPNEGQAFLDYLLNIVDGNTRTNFEILFNLFNDKDIQQVSAVVGFFANERSNRRNFVYGLYKLWEKSNYNFNYIDGVIPDALGLNPDSYFYTDEGKKYFEGNNNKIKNIALEFGVVWQGTGVGDDETTTVPSIEKKYYPPKLQSKNVVSPYYFIDVEKTLNSNKEVVDTQANMANAILYPPEVKFHLYQPITLVGYKTDEELEPTFPKKPFVPAFLWYYSEEFRKLKDFHENISFAIDVGIEVGLFFLTGGVSTLAELRYLRYATDIAKAIKYGNTTTHYTVLVLKGLSSAVQAVTVTSAVCERYYDLLINLNDPNNQYTVEQKKYYEYLHKIFLNLTLISAGVTGALEYGVGKYARKILTADSAFLDSLAPEIRNLIGEIAGYETAVLNTFKQQKLAGLAKISEKFEQGSSWSIVKQKKFYEDFKNLSNTDLIKLNNDATLTNWEKLLTNNILDRLVLDIVTDTEKSNRIVKYYQQYKIRIKLSNWDSSVRWKFLNKVQDDNLIFERYKIESDLLDGWHNYYNESNLTISFFNFTADKQIKFLSKYKNNVAIFKENPQLINKWDIVASEAKTASTFETFSGTRQIEFLEEQFVNISEFKQVDDLLETWDKMRLLNRRKDINFIKRFNLVRTDAEIPAHTLQGLFNKAKSNMTGGHLASEVNGTNLRLRDGTTDLNMLPTDINGVIIVDQSLGLEKFRVLVNAQGTVTGSRWMPKNIGVDEPHTFFPINWNGDMVLEQFTSALMNPTITNYQGKSNGFVAVSDSGIKIGWWMNYGGTKEVGCFPIPNL